MRVTAVILAAGSGRRMRSGQNKAFLAVANRPLLSHAIEALARSCRIDDFVLVAKASEEDAVRRLLSRANVSAKVVRGGASRRDSALAGVEAARGDFVLIHDGARPFPTVELIERVLDGAIECGACAPIVPVADTLRRLTEDDVLTEGELDRNHLVGMQTPQGFRRDLIQRALWEGCSDMPDDVGAVLALGEPVRTVRGDSTNLKVTIPEDLMLAEAIAELRKLPKT